MHGGSVVGHDFTDVSAVQDHVAPVDPNALACVTVIIEEKLPHENEWVIGEDVAELCAILAGMLDDELMAGDIAPTVRHVHCDHKFHYLSLI